MEQYIRSYCYNPVTGNYEKMVCAPEAQENSATVKPEVDLKYAKWNGETWVLYQTQEQEMSEALELVKRKQLKRRNDGINAMSQLIAEYKIAVQLGYVTAEENILSTQELLPVSNLISLGEWEIAKIKLIEIGYLTIGANLYNTIINRIDNYLSENS